MGGQSGRAADGERKHTSKAWERTTGWPGQQGDSDRIAAATRTCFSLHSGQNDVANLETGAARRSGGYWDLRKSMGQLDQSRAASGLTLTSLS